MDQNKLVFGPCSYKQKLVFDDNFTDVLLIGGGAGGGKSYVILTKFLQLVNNPSTKVVILRQTAPQLKLSGSLIDTSWEIYPHVGGVYRQDKMRWTFPSGATIQFAAIDSKKALEGWKGSQVTHILIDEAADWPEDYIIFLLSRLRSATFNKEKDGKLQLIMSCNPDNGSFLLNWVRPFLDEDGVPHEGTEKTTTYFVSVRGKVVFGSSPEQLYEEHGAGLVMGETFIPKSFRFIPMSVYDNKVLLKNNPDYLASLLAQSRVNQLRFLKGSWFAKEETAGYFKRESVEIIPHLPQGAKFVAKVRGYDLAATPEPSENNQSASPDYTVGILMFRDTVGTYYVVDMDRYRKSGGDVMLNVLATAEDDGKEDVVVCIPRDLGAGGVAYHEYFKATLIEAGVRVKTEKVSTRTGKVERFLPFAGMAENGRVKVVRGEWNEAFFKELEDFDGTKSGRYRKDDIVDACATAFNTIAKAQTIGNFSFPDGLTQQGNGHLFGYF